MRPKLAEVPDLIEAPLFVDHVAIAQHYGLRTGLLDLTESVNVAAFFATNELLRDGRWVPATDGWGVIYRLSVPRSRSPQEAEKDLEWMSPIGYQPFPRPNEQWAWAYELGITQDFWTLPDVEAFMFPHIADESRRWHERFSCGSVLFPPDDLADVATDVNNATELPFDLADRLIRFIHS
jgi:hypothetical protein